MIVLEDANLAAAADAVVQGRLTNGAGQICCAVKRVFVQETVYDDFLDLLLDKRRAIRMGDPASEDTDLGPLITTEVSGQGRSTGAGVDRARCEGASRAASGRRASFYEPTVLVDVTPEMPVM